MTATFLRHGARRHALRDLYIARQRAIATRRLFQLYREAALGADRYDMGVVLDLQRHLTSPQADAYIRTAWDFLINDCMRAADHATAAACHAFITATAP